MAEEETEYRIEFQIQRKLPKAEDFVEIGFGSSGGWSCPESAVHALNSDVQNYRWETEKGQPEPREIKAIVEKTSSEDY